VRRGAARGLTVLPALVLLGTVACSGGGDDADPGGRADPSITMSEVTAEAVDGAVQLTWAPVEGIDRYRLSDDETSASADVPAGICAERCALTIGSGGLGGDGDLFVRAVNRDGDFSAPVATAVDPAPAPARDERSADGPLEVVLVHGWDAEAGGRPQVDVVPADSPEQADRIVADARRPDSGIVAADLNVVAEPVALGRPGGRGGQDAGAGDRGDGDAGDGGDQPTAHASTWQVDAMGYDRIPGDPRGEGITIGLVEGGGPDPSHPSLQGVVEEGVTVGDPSTPAVATPELHATATASLIAGQDGGEVPGIAPGATVVPVAVGADASAGDIVEGIIAAVDEGVDVVNVSMASLCDTIDPASCPQSLQEATDYAEAHGVVVVASAGNNGPGGEGVCSTPTNAARSPAVIDTVISVGAYQPDGDPWVCSPTRPDVDLLAPGTNLLHAAPGGGYGMADGTSFSAPLVTGFVAALMAAHPDLPPVVVRSLLSRWRDAEGRLDVTAALVSLGLIDADEARSGLPDGVVGVYPYEVGLAFAPEHPIGELFEHLEQSEAMGQVLSWPGWWGSPYQGSSQEAYAYGIVTGLVYVHEDGTATATGAWTTDRIDSPSSYQPDGYGQLGPYDGHGVQCEDTYPAMPAMRVVRWDLPVAVDARLATGGDGDVEGVELTFGLGRDDVSADGELPEPTVVYDTWDRCAGQIAAHEARYDAGSSRYTWEENSSFADDYFATVEQINRELVGLGPITTAEPIVFGEDEVTAAAEDPDVLVGYETRFDEPWRTEPTTPTAGG
jgi:subtilase family protein